MNTLCMIEKLKNDRTKSFKMINYDDLKMEYGNQILGEYVINFSGKVCYQMPRRGCRKDCPLKRVAEW